MIPTGCRASRMVAHGEMARSVGAHIYIHLHTHICFPIPCKLKVHRLLIAVWVKPRMVSWAFVDAVRELRFWASPSTAGCPWGFILLAGVLISCISCCIGVCIGTLIFSTTFRKLLIQVLHLVCSNWIGGPLVAVDHRGRIAEYRRRQGRNQPGFARKGHQCNHSSCFGRAATAVFGSFAA